MGDIFSFKTSCYAVTFKKVVCNPTIRVSAMHLVATFLVLCALSAESWAQTCDRFHNRGVLFLGGTGKLVIHLGATKQELDQGDISMKISNCDGTCIIKSRWENAVAEGTEDDTYEIELTDKGKENLNKDRGLIYKRRKFFPVSRHVRLSLSIDSGTVEGIPKIPKVESVSFGGVLDCAPRNVTVIGEICERLAEPQACPAVTEETDGFSVTLNKEKRRWFMVKIQFASDVEGLKLKKTPGIRRLRLHKVCGSAYVATIRRSGRSLASKNFSLSFTVEGAKPEITFISTRSRKCEFTCGTFNGCPKPTLPPTTLATTTHAPTTTTEAPTTTTEAPPSPPETTTESSVPTTAGPDANGPPPIEGSGEEEEVKDVLGDEFDFDDLW